MAEDFTEDPISTHKKPKVFINWVDSYTGSNIGQFLSSCSIGNTVDREEEEEMREEDEEPSFALKKGYDIIGTLRKETKVPPSFVTAIVSNENRQELERVILNCDVILFDIAESEEQVPDAVWAIEAVEENIATFRDHKMFILLSTVLTWVRTKGPTGIQTEEEEASPAEETEAAAPFTEDDYRRRRAHPHYRDHIQLEKDVIRVGKIRRKKVRTYIIATGIRYGKGENVLHYFFKTAWFNAPSLPCVGSGKNTVPMIYITDLALVVQNVIEKKPKPPRYILGVEGVTVAMYDVYKAISEKLTTGLVHKIGLDDAFLLKEIGSTDLDLLSVNLAMESVVLSDTLQIQWRYEGGIVPNMDAIVQEFKQVRGLHPIRIFIHGPPGSGRRTIRTLLCDHYRLHSIFLADVVQQTIAELTSIAAYEPAPPEEDEEVDELFLDRVAEAQDFLRMLHESREANNGVIEDQYLIKMLRDRLLSMPCQNQGFVLYGFPETLSQAKDLFAASEEDVYEEGNKEPIYNTSIMPDLVISLDAPDDFLKEKVMAMSETRIVEFYGSEEEVLQKLIEFRQNNTEDESVLNYFDENEIRIMRVDISRETNADVTFRRAKKWLGPPKNYGPTAEEIAEQMRIVTEEKLRRELEEDLLREHLEQTEIQERSIKTQEWTERLGEMRRQEEEELETQSLPLRNYLMRHVMPVLTKGLMDCVKLRPEDPIDYLAEYLFKYTPVDFPQNMQNL